MHGKLVKLNTHILLIKFRQIIPICLVLTEPFIEPAEPENKYVLVYVAGDYPEPKIFKTLVQDCIEIHI